MEKFRGELDPTHDTLKEGGFFVSKFAVGAIQLNFGVHDFFAHLGAAHGAVREESRHAILKEFARGERGQLWIEQPGGMKFGATELAVRQRIIAGEHGQVTAAGAVVVWEQGFVFSGHETGQSEG